MKRKLIAKIIKIIRLEFMYEFDMADKKEFTWVELYKIIVRIRRKLYKEISLTNETPSLIKKGKK